MKSTTSLFVLALAIVFVSNVFAQSDFYWSLADLNEGSVNENLNLEMEVGETATLFFYFTTRGPSMTELDTGCFFDVFTSTGNTINFQEGETFDFDIVVPSAGNVDIGCRFGDSFGPGTVTGDGQVLSMNAFTVVSGTGIVNQNTGPVFFDQGYDIPADAFLFAKITIEATECGTVDILTGAGTGGIIHDGMFLDPVFGIATINVNNGVLLGDVNQDGFVTLQDVQPFVDLIVNNGFQVEADVNQDGFVDLLDVAHFIDAIQFP